MITLSSWQSALSSCPALHAGCTVMIGNFDGCHRGHQKLIGSAIASGKQQNLPALALTFMPHPRVFFKNLSPWHLLFTTSQKSRALCELGVDVHLAQGFDATFAELSAADFATEVLVKGLRAREVFIGSKFRFGKNRKAGSKELESLLARHDIRTTTLDPQTSSAPPHKPLSSSLMRGLMKEGNLRQLTQDLARPLLFEQKVERGQGLGKQWGYPTANLRVHENYPLKNGAYSGWVSLQPQQQRSIFCSHQDHPHLMRAVLNKGVRPTLSKAPAPEHPLWMEVHILEGSDMPQQGQNIGVYLVEHLRDERTFPSTEHLRQQISVDIQHAHRSLDAFLHHCPEESL